jgi:hypothetical protein
MSDNAEVPLDIYYPDNISSIALAKGSMNLYSTDPASRLDHAGNFLKNLHDRFT